MYQPVYNNEERKLIEAVHSAFEKVELDPNVAIGQVGFTTPGHYHYSSFEAEQFEAFFRGISWKKIKALWKQDNSFFYPARYKPIPWWQVPLDGMVGKFLFDDIFRMNPYGKYYYLPYFMLVQIRELNAIRCGLEQNFGDDLWHSLIVPKRVVDDCWAKIDSLSPEDRDPLNKFDRYVLNNDEEFLVFLSFFNEDQKRVVSNLIRYGVNISFQFIYNSEYEDEQEMWERLKSVWSF